MSVKKAKTISGRSVAVGMLTGIIVQLILSAVYALAIVKGRGEAENAGTVMYAIAFAAALFCGMASSNSAGGTKLSSLAAGLSVALMTAVLSIIICTDDISAANCFVIFSIFMVASYMGAMLKLGKSNKKIQKFRNKKK